MPRMGKTKEDWNGLGFLKTVQPNYSFSKLIPAACNFKNNAQETYLFVMARLLPNGRPVARGAQGKSMGDQISVQGARAGAWLNTRH